MVELVDTRDLKSLDPKRSCGFESRSRHYYHTHTCPEGRCEKTALLMRKFIDRGIVMATTLAMTILAFILTACSGDSGATKIDARFLNMNQATFYVYSPDGVIAGIDTIRVNGGRFTYTPDVRQKGTLVMVFPNFATMPIFVQPGADISIDANAASLRSMEITGTKDNETFTEWRRNSDKLSPAEMKAHAERFINDHPTSPISIWLLRQYFVACEKPDMKRAQTLLATMTKAMNDEDRTGDNAMLLARTAAALRGLVTLNIGDPLPRFSAKDMGGKPVTNGKLLKGTTVICAWTTWNYDSHNMLRRLAGNQRSAADSLKVDNVLTICLDPDTAMCRRKLRECGAEELTTVCDTMMWASPLVKAFGITTVPYNLKVKDGKITGRCVPHSELVKK